MATTKFESLYTMAIFDDELLRGNMIPRPRLLYDDLSYTTSGRSDKVRSQDTRNQRISIEPKEFITVDYTEGYLEYKLNNPPKGYRVYQILEDCVVYKREEEI